MSLYTYRSNQQIERFMAQATRMFGGFQVKDGVIREGETEPYMERVPVVYGAPERVIAAIFSRNSRWTNYQVPMMATHVSGIEIQDDENRNPFYKGYDRYKDDNGYVHTIERIIGPALKVNFSLDIYTSSVSQMFELIEQILLVFNPSVVIQKSVDMFDENYISEIFLESMDSNVNYPVGQQEKVITYTLNFSFDMRLNYPRETQENITQEIHNKIFSSDGEENVLEETDVITESEDS